MATIRGDVDITVEQCKGCELCIVSCPQDGLALSNEINKQGYHYAVLIEDVCTGCMNCALVCPEAIITVYREDKKSKARVPVAEIRNVTSDITVRVNVADEASA
jgi:2-oxoglutarate ferredoxin oxidoreductase subunit delta